MRSISAAPLVAAVLLASGCSTSTGNCLCTQEFRAYSLAVVDQSGDPVDGVTIEVRNLRTNQVLESTFLGLLPAGHYWIVDDNLIDAFSVAGDSVRVTGTTDTRSFETGLRFGRGECGCHVEKLSGPDSVVIQ